MKKLDSEGQSNLKSVANKSVSIVGSSAHNIFKKNVLEDQKDSQSSNIPYRLQQGRSKSHNTTAMQRFKTQNSKFQNSGETTNKRMKTQSTQQLFLGSPFRGSPGTQKKILTTQTKTHNRSNSYLDHDAIHFVEKVAAQKDKSKYQQLYQRPESDLLNSAKQRIRQSSNKGQSEEKSEEESAQKKSKISQSRKNSSKSNILSSHRKQSGNSQRFDDETSQAYQEGELRTSLGQSRKNSYKPVIRSFSHADKLDILKNNKYAPKTEEEKRMEERYVKGQQKLVDNVRELQQFDSLLLQYQRNKKFMAQQSMKKHEMKRIMNSSRIINLTSQTKATPISKSISLPRLKPINEIQLPCPEGKVSKDQEVNKKTPCLEHSFSVNRFQHLQKSRQNKINMQTVPSQSEELDDIQSIQRLLNRKGIEYQPAAIRKGLLSVRIKTEWEGSEKIEMPKKLVSNPMYKKYPL